LQQSGLVGSMVKASRTSRKIQGSEEKGLLSVFKVVLVYSKCYYANKGYRNNVGVQHFYWYRWNCYIGPAANKNHQGDGDEHEIPDLFTDFARFFCHEGSAIRIMEV
jgi:hypothetical protein